MTFSSKRAIKFLDPSTGFTLIEVLLVIGIAVVLGSLAIVNLYGRRTIDDLNETSRQMATTLREAASLSMSQRLGASWGVRFDNTNAATPFYALFSGSSYSPSSVTSHNPLPKTVQYSDPGVNAIDQVTFNQISGTPSDPNFRVEIYLLGDQNQTSTVTVLPTGAISYDLLQCAYAFGCSKQTITIGPGKGGPCPQGQPGCGDEGVPEFEPGKPGKGPKGF